MNFNWFVLSLIAAFAFSGMALLYRIATDRGISAILGLFYIIAVASILLGVYIFAVEKSFVAPIPIITILIIAGVLSFLGNALLFKSIATAPNPGYAEAVGSLRIVIITTIAIFLFNLKPTPIGILGSIVTVIGIILLSTVG